MTRREAAPPMKPGETPVEYLSRPEVATQLDITVYGEDPPIAMIYYYDYWYPIAGGLAIGLGLFILATPTLGSRRRGLALLIVGFGQAVGFFWVSLHAAWFPDVQIRRYHVLNWGEKVHFHQPNVGLAAALLLTLPGVLELRRSFGGPKVEPAEPARSAAPVDRPAPPSSAARSPSYLRGVMFPVLALCWTCCGR